MAVFRLSRKVFFNDHFMGLQGKTKAGNIRFLLYRKELDGIGKMDQIQQRSKHFLWQDQATQMNDRL